MWVVFYKLPEVNAHVASNEYASKSSGVISANFTSRFVSLTVGGNIYYQECNMVLTSM
jgi:hypothetical protein